MPEHHPASSSLSDMASSTPVGRESPAPTVINPQQGELYIESAAIGAVHDRDIRHENEEVIEKADPWFHDPDNPRNWTNGKKWMMTGIVSMYCFVAPLASSMMAPALSHVAKDFRITNPTIIALTLTIYLLAFAIGPLFVSPLSEIYGRRIVLNVGIVLFTIFNVACALAPNTAALIVFRFFAGLAGSGPLAIGAGSISDLFDESQRAAATGLFTMGPLLGPIVGPVAGGFIGDELGQEWIFWILTILGGVATLIGLPLLKETYAPVIIAEKERAQAQADGVPYKTEENLSEVLKVNLTRPLVLLTTNFICSILALYQAVIYGFLYLFFTTFPELFRVTYGWSAGIAGLGYLGVGIGFMVGTVGGAKGLDAIYVHLKARNGGVAKPEFRIPVMFLGSLCVPVGLLWYGWSADQATHWIVPILGSGVFGLGMMLCFLPIQVYMVDTFKYAASANAATTLLRSLFGFAFPLFASQMFEAMGVGPGYSLLAGLSVLIGVPFPIYIYYRGEQLRAKSDQSR